MTPIGALLPSENSSGGWEEVWDLLTSSSPKFGNYSEPRRREGSYRGSGLSLRFTLRREFLSAFRRIGLLCERIGLRVGAPSRSRARPAKGIASSRRFPSKGLYRRGKELGNDKGFNHRA